MLFSSVQDLQKSLDLATDLAKVEEFIKNFTMDQFEAGTSIQVADNIKANLIEYQTKTREEGFWEAHKKMIDVHYILQGSELADLDFTDSLEKGEYQPEREMYELFGEPSDTIRLDTTNNFLLLLPDEAHRTGVKVGESETLRKIVFKIEK